MAEPLDPHPGNAISQDVRTGMGLMFSPDPASGLPKPEGPWALESKPSTVEAHVSDLPVADHPSQQAQDAALKNPFLDSSDVEQWLETLEKIVDGSANMVVVTDRDRRIKWVNATYTLVTGWSLPECVGKRPGDFLHGPATDRDALFRLSRELKEGHSASGVELTNYRKSGEPYQVSMNIEPLRDRTGEVIAYMSIQSDVTERRKQELRTAKLKSRLEEAQRLGRLGRIETEDDSGLTHWSDEVFRMVGQAPDPSPRSFADLLEHAEPDGLAAVRQAIDSGLASGAEIQVEFRVTGVGRWVRCRGLPLPVDGGFSAPLTWSVQDVTFYKSRFEEKRRLNEELNRLVVERTRKLEESNKALEEFSFALSHDLRAPLRHMASFAELLKEELPEGTSEAGVSYCNRIVASAGKMQALIEGMLSFAQLGRNALRLEWVDLGEMIRDLVDELGHEVEGRTIEWRIQPGLPQICCDPVLMREVWVNLLDNAIKYTSERAVSVIEVDWTLVNGGWEFVVRDNGTGFDPAHARKLFGMFQRLHSGHQFKGAGIGLALVRRILDSHGGRIWATAEPGQGAAFYVYLPWFTAQVETGPADPVDQWPTER
jgi:PAS domain S-box-containing protein